VIAGVDGCPGGWAVATASGTWEVAHVRELEGLGTVVIDVPIGLLESGPRACDLAARRLLGRPRSSSVFPAPSRALLGDPEPRCSAQLRNILPRIAEVDAYLASAPRARLFEGHPEVSFALMAGGRGLRHSKRTPAGREERRRLLAAAFPAVPERLSLDAVDAYALLWTAGRLARGEAVRLGGETDPRGLSAQIVA
jgi:predicted RNase H-like nuclease